MNVLGSIVISVSGRDKSRIFIIVGVLDEEHVAIADGRLRKIEKPKKKKLKHLRVIDNACSEAQTLLQQNKLTNDTAAKITASYHKS